MYTLDKVITAIVKQVRVRLIKTNFTVGSCGIWAIKVQTILGDNKCQELWHLLKSIRRKEVVTLHDIVRYRREAEHHVGSDDHLYKIDCVSVCTTFLTAMPSDFLCVANRTGRCYAKHEDSVTGTGRTQHERR